MKNFKKIFIAMLAFIAALCFAAAFSACGGEEKFSHTEGEWDERENVFLGMVSGEDCPNGNISADKVSKDVEMDVGKEYYLIVDFTLQPLEDNDGSGKVNAAVGIKPAVAVSAILEETSSGTYSEDVTDDVKTISVEFSIPDKAATARDRRIVIRLIPLEGSEYDVTVSFNADKQLAGNLSETEAEKTVRSRFTAGLTYGDGVNGGYCVSGSDELKELTEICIPCYKDKKYITEIAESAFFNYKKLNDINIPAGTVKIGKDAFYNCLYVKRLTIPERVETIENFAFCGCAITEIKLPASVTQLGYGAFSYCSELGSIFVDGGNARYFSKNNCIIEKQSKTLISGCKNSVIPDDGSVQNIAKSAFSSVSPNEITIPDTIKTIGDYAFCNSTFTKITIPDSVTEIGEGAFFYGYALQEVTLGNNVSAIEKETFSQCFYLLEITIPNSVKYIGEEAFSYSSLARIVIPDGVTEIGERAFYDCRILKEAVIGNGVQKIGADAFSGLKEIYYNGDSGQYADSELNFNLPIYFYSENEPTQGGNFWHYENGEPVSW